MKKYFYTLCIVAASTFSLLNAQTRHYDVILFGDNIGEISTQKNQISNSEYELSYTSEAEAEVFFVHNKTFVQAKILYKDNFVKDSYLIRKKNKEVQEVDYNWENNQYSITENGKKSINKEKIYFCSTDFFFKEPTNIHRVYIERLLKFAEIEHLGDNQYLTKVDGGSNLYTYKNGVLQSLKSKKGISIYMNLRE